MAGFEAPVYIFQLEFEKYDGLEIKARSVKFGKLLNLADELDELKDLKEIGRNSFATVKNLVDEFIKSLKSWNITEGGEPVSCDREGFDSLDFTFGMDILSAWSDAIGGTISGPLADGSNDGAQSVAPMIQMETL